MIFSCEITQKPGRGGKVVSVNDCVQKLGFAVLVCTVVVRAGEPAQPVPFRHAGVVAAWKAYADRLSFGKGQTLALVDDGCTLSRPEWQMSDGGRPKVLVTYDSVDGDKDPSHEGKGYHGTTVGIPSSVNHGGKWGVAYRNQLAVIRALECCHCNVSDDKTVALALQWVIDHHKKYRITTVNLAPVDDLEHAKPVPGAIVGKLKKLRALGIWVSAPAGNHKFTNGISWPACQPKCFAIGAVRPGKDEVFLDRHAKVDLVVPAAATSSSNAIVCGAVMVLREAIEKAGYNWKSQGETLPDAMLAIFQKTGVAVNDTPSGNTFRRLNLKAALDFVFAVTRSELRRRQPNILLAISDDQSWMHAGAYGDRATRTPVFDRIAEAGVLFTRAFAACPSCAPSRSSILTGRPIWQLGTAGVLFGVLRPGPELFTLELKQNGYELASTGKTWGPGRIEGFAEKGGGAQREAVMGQSFDKRRLADRRVGINPNDYAANFDDFLAERDSTKPFFFWFGATEPHQTYEEGAWKRAGKRLDQARLPRCLPDDPVTRGEILDYGLEIEHFDSHLGRMLKSLKAAGELKNTLVIVTSDHGNPLPRSKCNLYDTGVRVPLAVQWPGRVPPGRRVVDLVSLIDLAPTILEAAGVEPPSGMVGRSLVPILESRRQGQVDTARNFIVTAFERHIIARQDGVGYPMRSIRTSRFAYIRNYEPKRWPAGDPDFYSSHQRFFGDCDRGASKSFILQNAHRPDVAPFYRLAFGRRPSEELYDLESDPGQLSNLAFHPKWLGTRKDLAGRLQAHLVATGDPRQRGESPWDGYPFVDRRIYQNPKWRTEGLAIPLRFGQ